MSENPVCPKCNDPLPANAPAGICPQCLLNAGFPTEPVTSGFTPPDPSELANHFPDLEIGELLGKGGMGAVYMAQQRRLDRVVAVKILPPEVSRDPTFAERFTREARTLARLNHPNIVQVYDFGKAGQFYYFVMEYVEGMNLRQIIESGKLNSQEALAIVPSICAALQFAHDAGVVHRDIKPENILIDQHGRVKIADFGLAMLLDREPADVILTATNQVMGTPHYMAPEQMRGAHAIDHRADIYSLGVVFYELLTGELPIGRFEPPSKKVQIDVRLDDVVLRTLESIPNRRYQQASEVKTEVESILSSRVVRSPIAKQPVPDDFKSTVKKKLRVSAIGLFGAGLGNLLATPVIILLVPRFADGREAFTEAMFLCTFAAIFSLVQGIILMVGAARMLDLQSHPVALAGAVAAVVPLSVGFLISLPFGVWTLIVLLRNDVRTAFADLEMTPSEQEPTSRRSPTDSAIAWTLPIGIALGAWLGTTLNNVAVYASLGLVIGILVGNSIDMNHRHQSKD